ncbi:hypothetical protein SDC9_111926 [bioreactor metagenome]|uniref:Uncharacterized protein n=1 Tax=bioreactor metagenome TaxID=1076179 RepID=A0A645BTA5_9ZZZZ
MQHAFAALARGGGIGNGLLERRRGIGEKLALDFRAQLGGGLFRIAHHADFHIGALRSLDHLLLERGEAFAMLIAVRIAAKALGDFGFVGPDHILPDDFGAPVHQQRGFGHRGMIIAGFEQFVPGRREVPDRQHDDHLVLQRRIEPFQNAERLLEMEHALAAAVAGQHDEVVEALKRQRFDDLADQIAEGVGLHVDGAGEHAAGKGVVQRRRGQAVEPLGQLRRAEIGIADVDVERQVVAVLFAQRIGNDDGFVLGPGQIGFELADGHILHPVTFHDKPLSSPAGQKHTLFLPPWKRYLFRFKNTT